MKGVQGVGCGCAEYTEVAPSGRQALEKMKEKTGVRTTAGASASFLDTFCLCFRSNHFDWLRDPIWGRLHPNFDILFVIIRSHHLQILQAAKVAATILCATGRHIWSRNPLCQR